MSWETDEAIVKSPQTVCCGLHLHYSPVCFIPYGTSFYNGTFWGNYRFTCTCKEYGDHMYLWPSFLQWHLAKVIEYCNHDTNLIQPTDLIQNAQVLLVCICIHVCLVLFILLHVRLTSTAPVRIWSLFITTDCSCYLSVHTPPPYSHSPQPLATNNCSPFLSYFQNVI